MPEITEKIRAIFREEGVRLIEPLSKAIQKTQDDVLLIKDDITGIREVVDSHTVTLDAVVSTLEDVKTDLVGVHETVDSHTAILDNHTAILENHTDILDSHTSILDNHTDILDSHTLSLDGIVGSLEDMRTESVVTKHRIDRHEGWIGQLAQKTKLKLSH